MDKGDVKKVIEYGILDRHWEGVTESKLNDVSVVVDNYVNSMEEEIEEGWDEEEVEDG